MSMVAFDGESETQPRSRRQCQTLHLVPVLATAPVHSREREAPVCTFRHSLIALSLLVAARNEAPQTAAESAAITAEEIVQHYIAARGGMAKLHAIRTLRLRGPARPDGRPPRQLIRARPFYFSIGTEGNDGSPWEGYDEYGLRARVTDAPAAALRHTAYFDDPLIMSVEPGWRIELTGSETVDGKEAYRLRVVFPDGWVNDLFVDKHNWLLIGRRFTAPFHAFGEAVTTQTLIGGYREVAGVLFPTRYDEFDLATGTLLGGAEWASIEANVSLPPDAFAPPPIPDTPVARMVNAVFAARFVSADALAWYHDFLTNPATAGTDIERAIESVAYQCLKNGAIPTGLALLEENLEKHPQSAPAHFGLGRAYRAMGRERDALTHFHTALQSDASFQPAQDAIASARLKY